MTPGTVSALPLAGHVTLVKFFTFWANNKHRFDQVAFEKLPFELEVWESARDTPHLFGSLV